MNRESNVGMRETPELTDTRFSSENVVLGPPEQFEVHNPDGSAGVDKLRLLWEKRTFLFRATVVGLVASTIVAFLISSRYTSAARLMPPDSQPSSGLAMVASLAGGANGLGGIAGDLLGMKSTSEVFVGVL